MNKSEWQFLLCSECGTRIPARCAHRPFPGAYLCDDCVDDLFLTSEIVGQECWPISSPSRQQ